MQKKNIFLKCLILLITFSKLLKCKGPELVHLNKEKYKKLIKNHDISIVLLFEQWCGYSKQALKEFKLLVQTPSFLEMNIPVGFFDIHKEEEFKKFKGIKKIPQIYLYIKQTEIAYKGNLDKNDILKFILQKTKLGLLKEVEDLDDFEELVEDKDFFIFFGEKNTARFKLYSEGFYQYPKHLFIWTENPFIGKKYGLKLKNIYFHQHKTSEFIKYKKAFKRNRFLNWVVLSTNPKYHMVENKFYERCLRVKNPTLVLVVDETENSVKIEEEFKNNYPEYFEAFETRICQKNNENCQKLLEEIPFKINKPHKVFIMTFHNDLVQPLYYLMKEEFELELFKKFLLDFKNNTIKYDIFSEDLEIDYKTNDRANKITRNLFRNFFYANLDKDNVIFYYESKCKECKKMVEYFTKIVKIIFDLENNKNLISFGYFDLSKNSHEILGIKNQKVLVKLYKMASMKDTIDLNMENINSYEKFREKFINFLSDTSTNRLEFNEALDEM